jgi:hypothetical protein
MPPNRPTQPTTIRGDRSSNQPRTSHRPRRPERPDPASDPAPAPSETVEQWTENARTHAGPQLHNCGSLRGNPTAQVRTRTEAFKEVPVMSDQLDQQPHPLSHSPTNTAFDPTGPTPQVKPTPVATPGDWPPAPSVSLPAGGTPHPTDGPPPRREGSAPPPPPSSVPPRQRSRIVVVAFAAFGALAAGTLLGHVVWPAPTANTSPAGTSSPTVSGGSSGGSSQSPSGSSGTLPTKQYPGASGGKTQSPSGSNGRSSQTPSGSGGTLPTKQYPGASGGNSQSPSGGSGGSMNPNNQYPVGNGGLPAGGSGQTPGGSSSGT